MPCHVTVDTIIRARRKLRENAFDELAKRLKRLAVVVRAAMKGEPGDVLASASFPGEEGRTRGLC